MILAIASKTRMNLNFRINIRTFCPKKDDLVMFCGCTLLTRESIVL
jgi:hypothetical protein